jgi:DNA-binding GntR family transcriptional regulator
MGLQVEDPGGYLRANWALHRRAAELCANDFARRLYEGLLDFAEAELETVTTVAGFDARDNLGVHEELVEAIASRDPQRVAVAVERHNAQSRAQRSIRP